MMVSVSKGLSVVVKEAADHRGRGVAAALVTKERSSRQKIGDRRARYVILMYT
jgi:hypothetical protein